MPLPLTVSCFSKIPIGFTFLVPAHPGIPGQRAAKQVCVCVCVCVCVPTFLHLCIWFVDTLSEFSFPLVTSPSAALVGINHTVYLLQWPADHVLRTPTTLRMMTRMAWARLGPWTWWRSRTTRNPRNCWRRNCSRTPRPDQHRCAFRHGVRLYIGWQWRNFSASWRSPPSCG